jgi:hypothetical protein
MNQAASRALLEAVHLPPNVKVKTRGTTSALFHTSSPLLCILTQLITSVYEYIANFYEIIKCDHLTNVSLAKRMLLQNSATKDSALNRHFVPSHVSKKYKD